MSEQLLWLSSVTPKEKEYMADKTQNPVSIIRRKCLEAKIGLGHSTIYARINPKSPSYDPTFPKPIALGTGANPPVGWVSSEVEAWLEAQIQNSRKAA